MEATFVWRMKREASAQTTRTVASVWWMVTGTARAPNFSTLKDALNMTVIVSVTEASTARRVVLSTSVGTGQSRALNVNMVAPNIPEILHLSSKKNVPRLNVHAAVTGK
jgi:hypothetical protein